MPFTPFVNKEVSKTLPAAAGRTHLTSRDRQGRFSAPTKRSLTVAAR
jgi:hypothetical protein